MSSSIPPRPLIETGSPQLRAALKQAQERGPSDAEIETLLERVITTVAAGAVVHGSAVESSSVSVAAAAASIVRNKWTTVCLVAAAAGLAGWHLGGKSTETASHASTIYPPAVARTRPADDAAIAVATRAELVAPAVEVQPDKTLPAQGVRKTRRHKKSQVATSNWVDDAAAENALIEPAVRALRMRQFDVVLKWVATHEQRYPRGALAQTREVLRIEALIALGASQDAAQRIERFRSVFSDSLYLNKLKGRDVSSPRTAASLDAGPLSSIDAEVDP